MTIRQTWFCDAPGCPAQSDVWNETWCVVSGELWKHDEEATNGRLAKRSFHGHACCAAHALTALGAALREQ